MPGRNVHGLPFDDMTLSELHDYRNLMAWLSVECDQYEQWEDSLRLKIEARNANENILWRDGGRS